MKYFLTIAAALFTVYSFSDFDNVQSGYTVQELRELYGSGDQSKWPAPHLFDEAKDGFKDVGVLAKPEFPSNNPYSKEKEELGKMLFFDPRLSKSGQISCANCHDPELG
ncbi:cytochrome-c peroxidase, partial [uncultured Chryseobacterium sp.]|uniref:cytochrome-c peroxidase n=1 Tax=uncultured Chryseobacterium sp. TaxID=259322 RepID=UPI0026137F82